MTAEMINWLENATKWIRNYIDNQLNAPVIFQAKISHITYFK